MNLLFCRKFIYSYIDEYDRKLAELQARGEVSDDEYENLRSSWIMRKIELGIILYFLSMNCYDKSLEPIYKKLGIDIKKCFCTMMNVSWSDQQKKVWENMFTESGAEPYESKDKSWIKGLVYENHPHITILYGSLDGVTPDMVKTVLSGWEPESLTISEISYFDSPDGEPYYCIIAKVDVTENICDARSRLELLPHINTFPDYKAHITLGYIKKDQKALSNILGINKKRTSVAPFTATPDGVVYDNNSGDPVTIL